MRCLYFETCNPPRLAADGRLVLIAVLSYRRSTIINSTVKSADQGYKRPQILGHPVSRIANTGRIRGFSPHAGEQYSRTKPVAHDRAFIRVDVASIQDLMTIGYVFV